MVVGPAGKTLGQELVKGIAKKATGVYRAVKPALTPYTLPFGMGQERRIPFWQRVLSPKHAAAHNMYGDIGLHWRSTYPKGHPKMGQLRKAAYDKNNRLIFPKNNQVYDPLATDGVREWGGVFETRPLNAGDDMIFEMARNYEKYQHLAPAVGRSQRKFKRLIKKIGAPNYNIIIKKLGGKKVAEYDDLVKSLDDATKTQVKDFESDLNVWYQYFRRGLHDSYITGDFVAARLGKVYENVVKGEGVAVKLNLLKDGRYSIRVLDRKTGNILDDFLSATDDVERVFHDFYHKYGLRSPAYKKGTYIPESNSLYYKVFVPKNIDDIVNRNLTAKDVMENGMITVKTSVEAEEALQFIKENALEGKAFIWGEGFIPTEMTAVFRHEAFAKLIEKLATTKDIKKAIPSLFRESKIEFYRSIAKGAAKGLRGKPGIPGTVERPFSVHLFAKSGTQGKFLEELMGGAGAEIQHSAESMTQYLRSMSKWTELNKTVRMWRHRFGDAVFKNNPEFRQFMDDTLDQVMGVPSRSLQWLTEHLRPLGIDELSLQRKLRTLLEVQAALKIGANPLLPLVNATQLWINTSALLGHQWVGRGYSAYLKNEMIAGKRARSWVVDEGFTSKVVGGDIPKLIEGIGDLPPTTIMGNVNHYMLYPFKAVEMGHNRGISFIAALLKGSKQIGLKDKALTDFAHSIVNQTQFVYGAASQPWLFGSFFVKPMVQFKTYFIHQLDFMVNLGKLAQQGVMTKQWELTYPFMRLMSNYGMLGGITGMPAMGYFMERSKKLNELALKHPVAFRGLPSLTGADMSRRLDLNFPDPRGYWMNWFIGPTGSDIADLIKASPEIVKGRYGEMTERLLRGLSPAISSFRGSLRQDRSGNWLKLDSGGRTVAKYRNTAEAIAGAFGFRTTKVWEQERSSDVIRMYLTAYRTGRKFYTNKIVNDLNRGDYAGASRWFQEANTTPVPGAKNLFPSHFLKWTEVMKAYRSGQLEISQRGLSKNMRPAFESRGLVTIQGD